jgi:integrase
MPKTAQFKVKFTPDRIDKGLGPPETGERYYYDEDTPGLVLRVTATGTRTFLFYRKVRGAKAPKKISLGTACGPRLDEVRRKVRSELLAATEQGIDPAARVAGPDLRTLGDLWEHYLEHHSKPQKRGWARELELWEHLLEPYAGVPLASIDTAWVLARHKARGDAGRRTSANRMRATLSSMFSHYYRVTGQTGTKVNPCRGVKPYPETPTPRPLSEEEERRLVAAIDRYEQGGGSSRMADVVRLLLWTGQRQGNVRSMRWADLDLDGALWKIPGEFFKNKSPHWVNLPPQAVTLLKRYRKVADASSVYVFPGRTASAPHIKDVYGGWRAILNLAAISGTQPRLHDLRGTVATKLARRGVKAQAIQHHLGHRDINTTMGYVRLAAGDIRDDVLRVLSESAA